MRDLSIRSSVIAVAIVVGLLPALATQVAAQKGGKPTSKPATGLFRCPGVDCPAGDPTAVPAVITDAIRGDQISMTYSLADGASLDTLGEFVLRLVQNGRFLFLDFANGSPLCGAACRRTFASIEIELTIWRSSTPT